VDLGEDLETGLRREVQHAHPVMIGHER
jgi:hypothetical protein